MVDISEELKAIDTVTEELYRSITFGKGERPPLMRLKSLFIEKGMFINNCGDEPLIMTVDQFINTIQRELVSGELASFHEYELSHRTELFGTIAHRFSTYAARFDLDTPEPAGTGINSIQFVKIDDAWQISSIVWSDETPQRSIPKQYQGLSS